MRGDKGFERLPVRSSERRHRRGEDFPNACGPGDEKVLVVSDPVTGGRLKIMDLFTASGLL